MRIKRYFQFFHLNQLDRLAVILILAQVLLVPGSWLLNVLIPDFAIHSLLSSEGIRWFFGHFTDNMLTPVFLWLLLLAMAYGSVARSHIPFPFPFSKLDYRQRLGLQSAAILFFIIFLVVILLTSVPQAILLSSSGTLFPSSFSSALIPLVAFTIIVCSVVYGFVSGNFKSSHDACKCLYYGICCFAPIFPVYIFIAQLIASIKYVMGF